jgi:hypothetical protein
MLITSLPFFILSSDSSPGVLQAAMFQELRGQMWLVTTVSTLLAELQGFKCLPPQKLML